MHTAYRLFHPHLQRPFNRKLRLLPVMGTNTDPLQVVYCYIPVNILLCRTIIVLGVYLIIKMESYKSH